MFEQGTLISHNFSQENLTENLQKHPERIRQEGDKPYVTVEHQLNILEQLNQFDFGRFLLHNQGVNGYWTDYMLTYPWYRNTGQNNRGDKLSSMEDFILNKAPLMLATQQRFEIFLQENQKSVKNNATLASIPCGMMGELLYLNYENIDNIHLVGVDYDANILKNAMELAEKKNLQQFTKLLQKDAWQLNTNQEFDLISSNGLNIYEPDPGKNYRLYQQFYSALKPGGKLVTSFLTYPPHLTEQCEWNMDAIDKENLLLQKIIFVDVINTKFQCYQSSQEVKNQLLDIGFSDVNFIYDTAKIFPTVIAIR